MQLLVLGGTRFLGHAVAAEAVSRGFDVTCLARGEAGTAPVGARFVTGDRDTDRGLEAVDGTRWDAVVDVSRQPGQVRRAVASLDAEHWVFVSTANVYASLEPHLGEDAELVAPFEGDVATPADYGPAKVACENAVRAAVDRGAAASATIARLGLIGGPGDETGRSGYWPWRFAHPTDGDVIVPDDPDFPVTLIDVRDVAVWLVDAAEHRLDGVFNGCGDTVSFAEAMRVAADVAGSSVPARPVAPSRLAELGVQAWMGPCSLPLWVDDPEWRWFGVLDSTRTRDKGLTTRPLRDTFAGALDYEARRGGPTGAGLTDDDERRIRAAFC